MPLSIWYPHQAPSVCTKHQEFALSTKFCTCICPRSWARWTLASLSGEEQCFQWDFNLLFTLSMFLNSFRTFLDENSWLLSICQPSLLRSWFLPRLPSRRRMWNREHFHKEFTKGGSTSACWTCRQRRSVTTRWKLDLSGLFNYFLSSQGFTALTEEGRRSRQVEEQRSKIDK